MSFNQSFKKSIYFFYKLYFISVNWLKNTSKKIYQKLKLYEIFYFALFLFHRYSPKQFNPKYVPENIKILLRLGKEQGLKATRHGQLHILSSKWTRFLFNLKNALMGGALQARVEKVIFYSYVTITIEVNNPFNRAILRQFLEKKIALIERLLGYIKTINNKTWDQSDIRLHIDVFRRNSLLQSQVIKQMHTAVKRAGLPAIIRLAQEGLKKGLQPVLVTKGISGSYWMRGPKREVLGLFKPFDEEIHAPNNPLGPRMQGSLGLRKTRWGCRVGESAHHEVGAFVVDEFFGFGIVPRTYYASFEHQTFFLAREDRLLSYKVMKKKFGSFQEYVSGFVPMGRLKPEEIQSIPLDEFQLLIVLDVIIGNTDRNTGNVLFGDEKIAAIDHGLCFPDRVSEFNFWYWSYFKQGHEPLLKPIIDLLNSFPCTKLEWRLKKKCFISVDSLARMNERIILFTQAINAGLLPCQLEELLHPTYLYPLKGHTLTLKEKALEQLQIFRENNHL